MRTSRLVLPLFVLLACSLGCFASDSGEKELKLAFITCSRDAQFFVPVKKGMMDASRMLGVRCDWLGTDGVDLPAQEEVLRQAVKDGYDGIAFNIIHPERFDAAIQEAVDGGVPVVAFNVDDHATPNARLSGVNQRLYEAGWRLGQQVLPRIPDGSRVMVTMHDEGVSALEDRLRGIQEVLGGKGIQWEVVISGNDAVKGAEIISEALEKHPDIRIVFCTGQADTEAAASVMEAADLPSDYWVAGFDLSPRILELIQNDRIHCTIDQQPYVQGFYPVVQLTHYLRYGIMPSDVDAGATIVDSSNARSVAGFTRQNYR